MKTRLELMEAQGKQYQWEQDQIAHMKVRYPVAVLIHRLFLSNFLFVSFFFFSIRCLITCSSILICSDSSIFNVWYTVCIRSNELVTTFYDMIFSELHSEIRSR
jgi:hypothetical protein